MSILASKFYERPPQVVAEAMLGLTLVRRSREGLVCGRIVEVESYLSEADPACHAARGRTRKNNTMFGPAGRLYVYAIHSRHCMNVVTDTDGVPSAVLIRAVEPLRGIPLMQRRRGRTALTELTRGPGRLCEAYDVDRRLDGWDLTRGRSIWIESCDERELIRIGRSVRIGISSGQDLPLRYYVVGNPHLSGTRRLNTPTD